MFAADGASAPRQERVGDIHACVAARGMTFRVMTDLRDKEPCHMTTIHSG